MKRKINSIKTPSTSISTSSASITSPDATPKSVVKPTASAISIALGNCAPCSEILAARIPKAESIQIMRPQKNEAYMLAPDDGMPIVCLIKRLEDDEGRFIGEEFYPVSANIQPFISNDIRLLNFQVGITEFGKHFIDCQKLPSIDGKSDGWAESKADLVKQAKCGFIRSRANFDKKQYEVTPVNLKKRPQEFVDLGPALDAAIGANVIDSFEHPIIKELGIKVDDNLPDNTVGETNTTKQTSAQEVENFELTSDVPDETTVDEALAEVMPDEDETFYSENELTGSQMSIEEAIA